MFGVEALVLGVGTAAVARYEGSGVHTFEGIDICALAIDPLIVKVHEHFVAGIGIAQAVVALADAALEGRFEGLLTEVLRRAVIAVAEPPVAFAWLGLAAAQQLVLAAAVVE